MQTLRPCVFMTSVVHDEVMKGISSGGAIPPMFYRFDGGEGEIRSKCAVQNIFKAFGISQGAGCAKIFENCLQ